MSVSGINQSLSGNTWMQGLGPRGTKESGPDYDQMAEKVLQDRDQDGDGLLSSSEMQMSRGRFEMVDTDKDGYVSAGELSAHLSSGDNNSRLNRLAAAIIKMQDSDGDGKLSQSESDLSRDDFEAADADGDGYLTQSEIANALGASANQNGQNGQNGMGEAGGKGADQEFSGPGSENQKGTHKVGSSDEDASKKAGKSEQMDLNGDGVVSPEEVQAVMMHGLAKAKSMVASGELTIKTAPNGVSSVGQGEGTENTGAASGAAGASDSADAVGKAKKLAWGKGGQEEDHVSGRHGVPMWLRRRAMEAYGGQGAGTMSQMQNLAAGAQGQIGAQAMSGSDEGSTTVAGAMPAASVAAGVVGAGDMISAHI